MKRAGGVSDLGNKKPRSEILNAYLGFVVGEPVDEVDQIDEERFFQDYISKRKPLKFRANSANCPIDISKFTTDAIVKTLAGAEGTKLQVERKHASGFGLGRKREMMQFKDIVEKLASGDDSYYLTTQYDDHEYDSENLDPDLEEEEEEEEDEEELRKALENDHEGDVFEDEPELKDSPEEEGGSEASFGEFDGHDDFDDVVEWAIPEHEMTEEEADTRVATLVQPPLTVLLRDHSFSLTPSIFGRLIPQQINLWMGSAKASQHITSELLESCTAQKLGKTVPQGNSSGLHHDHADNLYVLAQGRKRFTLYSPADAEKLFTVGRIKHVFPNGLINYHTDARARYWRQMRQDGALLAEWSHWMLETKEDLLDDSTKNNLKNIIAEDEAAQRGLGADQEGSASLDPPSFSAVPPLLAHLDELSNDHAAELVKFAESNFPGFLQLNKLEVFLSPGEMLYLPTGWFHEVTSYAGEASPAHVALNWWFVPPSLENDKAYTDNYWDEDYKKTLAAVDYYRESQE